MEPTHFATPRERPICCWPGCFQMVEHHDLPLCEGHLREAGIAWVRDNLDVLREVVDATPVPVVIAREHDAAVQRLAARPAPAQLDSVVYYARLSDDVVKIGTTTRLPGRMAELRLDMSAVIATEPGGFGVEWRRHQQFAEERYGRREDFALSDRLAAHIATLSGRPVIRNS